MTPNRRKISRAVGELGEVVSAQAGEVDFSRYAGYETAVEFTEEELGDTDPGPWSAQREAMRLIAHNDRVAWRGAQGVGKDWAVARIALWWIYVERGLVLLSGPTARQVHEIIVRKELARPFRRAGLPGELFTTALRVNGEEADLLAFTSNEASGLTGFHDERVLGILTEAQAVDRHGWEGLLACTTGEDDRLFVVGNPLQPSGKFYEVSRPGSGWQTLRTAATDHPNLREDGQHIPGGPSREWLERMREMWGEGQPMWVARVEGRFPADAVEGLNKREWVDAAIERDLPRPENAEPVVAVDPARHGMDRTAVAVRRGRRVEQLVTWGGASTTETEQKVERVAHGAGVRPSHDAPLKVKRLMREKGEPVPWGSVVVDEIGIGAGVMDGLEESGWPCRGWKGSRKADESGQFANARAEAYWTLRELLEGGKVSLPDDRKLREELLAVKWSPNSRGQVQIESKDDLKSRLGRSPDRLDAVTMAVHQESGTGGMTAEEMIAHW